MKMIKSLQPKLLFLLILCFPGMVSGQIIVTQPALPTDNIAVKVTFDATQGTAGLKDYTGDVYAHTGVITDKSTSSSDWKYVKTAWGTNTAETKLTRITTNTYELTISPDVRTYYGVPQGEKILKLAFVFRSSDSQKEGKDTGGKDIFATIYEDVYAINITNPTEATVAALNQSIIFSAAATKKSNLNLSVNGLVSKSLSDTVKINDTITFSNTGDYWIKVSGTYNTSKSADSVFVTVLSPNEEMPVPAGNRTGINYNDDHTATLVLYAPNKQYVYVLGDFNNWLPTSSYKMKKDGDRFWITINNLSPQKEYIFQYLVDGTIRIADPYTEKVSDPYDDKYITSSVYPDLIAYPSEKTYERASVLQTGQTAYAWQNTNYTIPEKKDLAIYELLIRDFTTEGTIKAAKEKIPYLKTLGINTVELMPFNEFEGNISWGYNPNFYFAPDKAYGTKNDYKDFIDACHANGIIVIQDIVLNHSFGSSPLARLYWDATNNRPAADNPWYNVTSPNTTYSWGVDFNHESMATKQFVDSVNKFWMSEYKIDGFRYDFAKGFTNTPGDGGGFDQSRINILERMANEVWKANPKAYVILELFAPNEEEKILTSYEKGMLVWGNINYNFSQAAEGNNDAGKSDFTWASAEARGHTQPGLVSYMESHDEERVMYNALTYGNSGGAYNIRTSKIALRRAGMASVFLLSIPGPKMVWQFGELGYDISIDYIGRTDPKPVHWDYLDDTARYNNVYKVYKAMLELRKVHPVFTGGIINTSVTGANKRINLSSDTFNVALVGNFDVYGNSVSPNFQHTGTWYDYFSGKSLDVTSTTQQVNLQPGEYRLYTDVHIPPFKEPVLAVNNVDESSGFQIYPNPAKSTFYIDFDKTENRKLEVYNNIGKKVLEQGITDKSATIPIGNLVPGLYFIKVTSNGKTIIQKIVKQ